MTNGDGADTADPPETARTHRRDADETPVEESAADETADDESAADETADDESAADPFATLGNETRIRIIDSLYEATGTNAVAEGLAYSELRSHAGVADKGNFNYHLDVLRDRFVEKAGDEYRLTFAGFEVAKALRAGAWADHEPRGPVEVEAASPLLDGEPLYASYDGSLVSVHPADGDAVFRIAVRPTGAAHRDLDGLADLLSTFLGDMVATTHRDICPYCHAPSERAVLDGAADDAVEQPSAASRVRWRYRFAATCPECGPLFEVPVGAAVARHPAVVGFYWDHGVDVRTERVWTLDVFGDDGVRPAADEGIDDGMGRTEYRVTLERDGDVLELHLDDSARVVETVRN